ncbi:hypothetical protein Taro_020318 [Colocasia esculenta]|uniref:Uncharacterized protein n=1 Tax=Colocasia esculenta TaxID=4460 RepID=A0A843UNC1_COLES|nr:hypothetical protein [Colocasia esculenta]
MLCGAMTPIALLERAVHVPVPRVGNDLWWYIVYQSFLVLTWNCVSWRSCGVTFHSMCITFLE